MITREYATGQIYCRTTTEGMVVITDHRDIRLELSHGAALQLANELTVKSSLARKRVRAILKRRGMTQ